MTLSDLKAGDKVVVETSGGMAAGRYITTVHKVTKHQIVTVRPIASATGGENRLHETRWRRDTGRMVGASGYHTPYLLPGTPELLAEVRDANRRTKLARQLGEVQWHKLNTATLQQIADLITVPPPPADAVPSADRS